MPQNLESLSLPLLTECLPVFDALRDEQRQGLLAQLVCAGKMSVGELAATSELSRTAVSHHVKILEQVGLISVKKQGTSRFCSANLDEALGLLKDLIVALESDLGR